MLMLKTILCQVPSGITPFLRLTPGHACKHPTVLNTPETTLNHRPSALALVGFGYFNDPVLMGVQRYLNLVEQQIGMAVPWTNSVPGAQINWTSVPDTRRRRMQDVLKTGKKNPKQIAQYVYYQNMTILRTCTAPYMAPDKPYDDTSEYPACPYYQRDWTDKQAAQHGYTVPWGSDYACRIAGTDGNMFGRPVTSHKLQVFIGDMFRGFFLSHQGSVDWYGIKLHKYMMQYKDMLNATMNPANAQYFAFGPMGLLNTTVAGGAPGFVSFPHYLNSDPRLTEAIYGMHPSQERHETYLAMEPQTGVIAKAIKRLQINYQMSSYELPQVQDNSSEIALQACYEANYTIRTINQDLRMNIPELPCDVLFLQELLNCLERPSSWQLRGEKIFFPMGWMSESVTLPQSDAQDLQDALYGTQDFAYSLQFWALVVAGICAALLLALTLQTTLLLAPDQEFLLYRGLKAGGAQHEPLLSQEK